MQLHANLANPLLEAAARFFRMIDRYLYQAHLLTWRVKCDKSGTRQRVFDSEAGPAYARELAETGYAEPKVVLFTST